MFEESGPTGLEPRPTINLFEQWEEGAHLPKLVSARNYSFPKRLVIPKHHKSAWWPEPTTHPLTYWRGVTLCPPELNDVSLAESVVILMRYAAIKEMNLNTEVQKPSLEEVLEFQGVQKLEYIHRLMREAECCSKQTTEGKQNIVFPVLVLKEDTVVRRIHGPEYQKQKKEIWQEEKAYLQETRSR